MEQLNLTTAKDTEKVQKILDNLLQMNREFQIMIRPFNRHSSRPDTLNLYILRKSAFFRPFLPLLCSFLSQKALPAEDVPNPHP